MGHLRDFDVELRKHLAEGDTETLVRWIKDQVLKSYKNGLAARKDSGDASQESGATGDGQ